MDWQGQSTPMTTKIIYPTLNQLKKKHNWCDEGFKKCLDYFGLKANQRVTKKLVIRLIKFAKADKRNSNPDTWEPDFLSVSVYRDAVIIISNLLKKGFADTVGTNTSWKEDVINVLTFLLDNWDTVNFNVN